MLSVVRYSQILGVVAVDSSTASHLGKIEDVWLDDSGRIAYLSSMVGYLPLEQIATVGMDAVTTYGHLVVREPPNLCSIYHVSIQSAVGEPLGWVEDFVFDWHTGEIVAYIVSGEIAESLGGSAILYPQDIQHISAERVTVQDGARHHLKSEAEGLKGFLTEKSHQVQTLVKMIGDRLHDVISPHDHPDVVHVKIKTVSDEMLASGNHDHHALKDATEFLHARWETVQQTISRAGSRARVALDAAWKQIAGKK